MNVFQLGYVGDMYQWLRPSSRQDMEKLDQVDNGVPVGFHWEPPRVVLMRELERFEERLPSDFPCLLGPPVFTPRSTRALRDLLEAHGQLLPLRSQDGEFVGYNVTTVIDALDLAQSDVTFMPDEISIVSVNRLAFRPEALAGVSVFKIPQLIRSWVFVTDPFVQRVKDHGLTGFHFKELRCDE